MQAHQTIVITTAGKGTRLGMDLPKGLLDIEGKPLIVRQLEMLKDFDDIRIVVGYKAEKVISTVRPYRSDILFVHNKDYETTNTLNSLYLGAQNGRERIISLDGDLLVHPEDFLSFCALKHEVLGICSPSSDDPVYTIIDNNLRPPVVTGFSRQRGDAEWSGLLSIHRDKLENNNTWIFELVKKHLPIRFHEVRCCEVDTPDDLQRARKWVRSHLS